MYGTYVHPALDSMLETHRVIAFVDEYAYLTRRVDEKSDTAYDTVMNRINLPMSVEFYKIWASNPNDFTVTFQHPDTTAALLKINGLASANLFFTGRQKLASLLGVDAVVTVRCLIYKKYDPTEASLINIVSIAATFGFAAMGSYTGFFSFQPGTDALYSSTTIHNRNGELLYLDKGMENVLTNLSPGGWKIRKNLPRFPYLK